MTALDTPPAVDDATNRMSRLGSLRQHPLVLSIASAALLNLAFAPFNQFYLAWIALVPWMLAVVRCRSTLAAAAAGYAGGLAFFLIMMHWLWHATIVGSAALLLYLSIYWALAAALISLSQYSGRRAGERANGDEVRSSKDGPPPCFPPRVLGGGVAALLLIPAIWTTCEWLRGWMLSGFAWGCISQTQVPILPMCQIADITGHFGISFWVVMTNVLVSLAILHRRNLQKLLPSACAFAAVTLAIAGYGAWRIRQTHAVDGPTILVVQPNFPHARGGAKLVTFEEQIRFHFQATEAAFENSKDPIDLVVWSETVLPAMNPEAVRRSNNPPLSTELDDRLRSLVSRHNTALVFGAYALLKLDKNPADADVRNSTYLYLADAEQQRYDKIHLVPFGESVWFKDTIPWLHRLFFKLAAYSVEYVITPGRMDQVSVFTMPHAGGRARFVTPICFESIDSALVARMFRGDGGKRADFIVNITNDGWFNRLHKEQNMQMFPLRAIENRAPAVRVSNTGISGVVDSAGRTVAWLPANVEGTLVHRIRLDPRVTRYTRWGNWFAGVCAIASTAMLIAAWRVR